MWGRRQMQTRFWWVNLKETHHLQNLGTDEKILKWIIEEQVWRLIWLVGQSVRHQFKPGPPGAVLGHSEKLFSDPQQGMTS
jgi:hypothetical protein